MCNGEDGSFRVLVENEACGIVGRGCAKAVTIFFQGGWIVMEDGEVTQYTLLISLSALTQTRKILVQEKKNLIKKGRNWIKFISLKSEQWLTLFFPVFCFFELEVLWFFFCVYHLLSVVFCRWKWRSPCWRARWWRLFALVSFTLCCWDNTSPSVGTRGPVSRFTSQPHTGSVRAPCSSRASVPYDFSSLILLHTVFDAQGRVCGLCGNFDGNVNNDMMSSNNQLEVDSSHFGNSWKVIPSCADVTQVLTPL